MAEEVGFEERVASWVRSVWSIGLLWISVFALALYAFNRGGRANEDRLALTLTVLEIFLALIAVSGFFVFRREVRDRAMEVATRTTPEAVRQHMEDNGGSLIRGCLDDAEVVARLEREFRRLRIEDADEAGLVDQDAEWQDERDPEG